MIKPSAAVYTKIAKKWKLGGPPARPSLDELKEIFEPYIKCLAKQIFLKEKRPAKMLVLGATPEFRNLGLKYGLEVWAADINPNMLEAMDKLIKQRKSKRNKKVVTDWLNMSRNLPKNYFDLVMAEQSFNIVAIKDWSKLFQEILHTLNPKGFILLKFGTVTAKSKRKSSPWAIKKFSQRKLKAGDLAWTLHFAPDAKLYNPKRRTVDLKRQPLIVDEALKKGKITKKQWQEHEKIGIIQRGGIIYNALPKQKTTKFLRKYFKILKIKHGKDFLLCHDMNIYWGKLK